LLEEEDEAEADDDDEDEEENAPLAKEDEEEDDAALVRPATVEADGTASGEGSRPVFSRKHLEHIPSVAERPKNPHPATQGVGSD